MVPKSTRPKRILSLRRILFIFLLLVLIFLLIFGAIHTIVVRSAASNILSLEETVEMGSFDCILVLGCGVRADGTPSLMLSDRLDTGISLYEMSCSDKLLMSGDHGSPDYDEVNTMKRIAVECGVPSENVFMDHAGFSTYESIYRAKAVFQAERILIVTQNYHLYRALYIAEKLGLDAWGVPAPGENYYGQSYRDFREALARIKDFFTVLFQPEPTYLGDVIPVFGDGNVTNDTVDY